MKLTGERPMQGATPDSLLAFHDAGYREVVARLGRGTVVDIGCGAADATVRMTSPDRFVIGADYSTEAVATAAGSHGQDSNLRFCATDGSKLGLRDGSVDYVVSSHIIEHFTNPALHVAELARVLRPDGTASVITPNATGDFENPFHVYLFEPAQLVSMLSLFFEDVVCLGLEGDDALHSEWAERRARGNRILKLDVFKLRHRMPRRTYVWAYEHILPTVYKVLGSEKAGVGTGFSDEHFFTTERIAELTPGLFAIARTPRPKVGTP
jgi:ubiquinone/menaquinone biosynthesis C-methylase UbiE